jgi:hypothetical protein
MTLTAVCTSVPTKLAVEKGNLASHVVQIPENPDHFANGRIEWH